MFDAKQHLIVCNKRYREIFHLPESLTQPGTPFAEIVRFHAKMETGRDSPEELEGQRKWTTSMSSKWRAATCSEKREAEHKISWLARHDALTELANRFSTIRS